MDTNHEDNHVAPATCPDQWFTSKLSIFGMKTIPVKIVLCMCLTVSLHGQSVNKDSVSLTIAMPQKEVSTANHLVIDFQITSHKGTPIEVPVQDVLGFILYHDGFIAIRVQRQINGKYVDAPIASSVDSYPGVEIDTLHTNDSKHWSFDISMLHQFIKGNYRIKALARLSLLNPMKDVYSSWHYFKCVKDIWHLSPG